MRVSIQNKKIFFKQFNLKLRILHSKVWKWQLSCQSQSTERVNMLKPLDVHQIISGNFQYLEKKKNCIVNMHIASSTVMWDEPSSLWHLLVQENIKCSNWNTNKPKMWLMSHKWQAGDLVISYGSWILDPCSGFKRFRNLKLSYLPIHTLIFSTPCCKISSTQKLPRIL